MILSIGKFSYKLIFPFLYAICTFLKTLTYSKGELKNPYVTLLFFSLAQLSMGILEIITQLRLKNVRKKKEETEKINLNSLAAEETNSTINSIHNEKEIKELLLTPKIIAQLFILAFFNSLFSLIIFAFENLEALSKYNFQYEIKFIGYLLILYLRHLHPHLRPHLLNHHPLYLLNLHPLNPHLQGLHHLLPRLHLHPHPRLHHLLHPHLRLHLHPHLLPRLHLRLDLRNFFSRALCSPETNPSTKNSKKLAIKTWQIFI